MTKYVRPKYSNHLVHIANAEGTGTICGAVRSEWAFKRSHVSDLPPSPINPKYGKRTWDRMCEKCERLNNRHD